MPSAKRELPPVAGLPLQHVDTSKKSGARKNALVASDLMSPETYASDRRGWHAQALAHRVARTVRVGPNALLIFEDEQTVRQQLQELLRVERISDPTAIQHEIDAYAALIPDGSNLKATFMVEFADAVQRRAIGPGLVGIERAVWIRVEGMARIFGIVGERVDSAATRGAPLTHPLVFELGQAEVRDLTNGGHLSVGVDHGQYSAMVVLQECQRRLLMKDLR